MAQINLPRRTTTMAEDERLGEDTSEVCVLYSLNTMFKLTTCVSKVTKLFHERLQAWKHACGYIEDYISTTEKMANAHYKEYEKVVKTVSQPVREAEHFDTSMGGVNEMFDVMRSSTQVCCSPRPPRESGLTTGPEHRKLTSRDGKNAQIRGPSHIRTSACRDQK